MGCCGDYSTQPINQQVFDPNSPVAPSLIRVEFIGTGGGVKTYQGFEGRAYRFGNNLQNKYVDVHPGDISKFSNRPDLFRVIPPPDSQVIEGVVTEIIEPEPTQIRQRRRAS